MFHLSPWRTGLATATLLLAPALSACSSQRPPLYYWKGYQNQAYSALSQKADPAAGIAVLERGISQAQSKNRIPAPGYYAELGYLYAQIGRANQARDAFEKEKSLFPESTPYMDRLLRTMTGENPSPAPAAPAPSSSSNTAARS